MKEGPDIARTASLIGDPARANMLTALMSGKALTASELATEAGITRQTASSHIKHLEAGGLIKSVSQGRHRYITLAGPDVAAVLEALMGLAAGQGLLRTRQGPRDPELRIGRVCYNHLAGETGVQLFRSLRASGVLHSTEMQTDLTPFGRDQMHQFGIDVEKLQKSRAPMCRECLDWSARESHLAGSLGRALLTRIEELGWAKRKSGTRIITFSKHGREAFDSAFPYPR